MKKIYTLFFSLILIASAFSFVVAADDEIEAPEVSKISGFTRFSERMKLAFTFNKEKKIEASLEMAERRLAYAEEIAEENPELAAKIQEEYDAHVKRAEELLSEMESDSNDDDGFENDVARIARIENRFEKHREIADVVYTRTMNRFEENNASEEKIARFEEFYERAQNRSDVMEKKALEKQNAIMERRRTLLNKSDEDFEQLKMRVEEREGILEAREARVERRQELAQNVMMVKERRENRLRLMLNNSNLTDAQRVAAQNRIAAIEARQDRINASTDLRDARLERIDNVTDRLDRVEDALDKRLADTTRAA